MSGYRPLKSGGGGEWSLIEKQVFNVRGTTVTFAGDWSAYTELRLTGKNVLRFAVSSLTVFMQYQLNDDAAANYSSVVVGGAADGSSGYVSENAASDAVGFVCRVPALGSGGAYVERGARFQVVFDNSPDASFREMVGSYVYAPSDLAAVKAAVGTVGSVWANTSRITKVVLSLVGGASIYEVATFTLEGKA